MYKSSEFMSRFKSLGSELQIFEFALILHLIGTCPKSNLVNYIRAVMVIWNNLIQF